MMNTALSFVNSTLENQSPILFPASGPDYCEPSELESEQREALYQQNTCGIVSLVAYLAGVEKTAFH